MFRLADVAPRLALARDQHEQRCRRLFAERRAWDDRELELRRKVAHRELQEVRSMTRRDRRYLERRQRLRSEAERMLADHLRSVRP